MQNIDEYIDSLSREFKPTTGGSYYHYDTGEIFSQQEIDYYFKRKLEKYNSDNLTKLKSKADKKLGVVPDHNIINNRSTQNKKVKTNSKEHYESEQQFNIVYREHAKDVSNMKLEVNEKLVYYTLRDFIVHPSNSIKINDEVPEMVDLEPIVGLKERTIRKALKSLEEKGLIKLIPSGHRKEIYVNPQYYATGKDLNKETLRLFGLLKFDEKKVESYLSETN